MDKDFVTMDMLAESFFDLYHERLKNNMPQMSIQGRRTAMERIVDLYNLGRLDRDEAITKVKLEAFNDVIPRFHTVNGVDLPISFYEVSKDGLIIKDSLFEVFKGKESESLTEELKSRWDLLESAFEMRHSEGSMSNDIRRIYLESGYDRKSITHTIPVLNGYQNGVCFYCGEQIEGKIHVDHVIPRQVIFHDEIWNLVLSHEFCNLQKSDYLPSLIYVDKLIARNEHFFPVNIQYQISW